MKNLPIPTQLQINDLFFTVQGEGALMGRRALFVRMPFCDLACSWCDTQFNTFKTWTPASFSFFAASEPCRFAVITGGEPTMHKHTPLIIRELQALKYYIAIETNGHFAIPEGIDFVTVSPKRDRGNNLKYLRPYTIHPDAFARASEFKYVVDRGFDFEVLKRHDTTDGRFYSLSPEYNELKENVARIMKFQSENPGWRLSLQTHKWIGVP